MAELPAPAAVLLDWSDTLVDGRDALPGASEFLRYLEKLGIPWAVVSNKLQGGLEKEYAKRFGDIRADTPLLGLSPKRKRKPAPDALFEAMDLLEIPADQRATVWMVGDSEKDLLAGCAAGCHVLWLGRGTPEGATPVRDHGELLALLMRVR